MTSEATYWIGQNGQKYGPYREADIRQWMAEGRFGPQTLGWGAGMPAWVPLSLLFPDTATHAPPPISTPPPAAGDFFAANPGGGGDDATRDRDALPRPPALHWGLVLLFNVLSLGIFGMVWPFIQSSWVRRIDPRSRATLLLGLAFGAVVVGYAMMLAGRESPGAAGFGALLAFASPVLFLVAYFSMAGSLERHFSRGAPTVRIGGVTLFFFNMYYLQGQLHWLAKWKETGRTEPAPPKGVFYLLWLGLPFVLGVLAAIAIPAYQEYVLRVQVSEGLVLAGGAESAVTDYYTRHGEMPQDSHAAGLDDDAALSGRYVSSVDVEPGKLVVHFDAPAANHLLHGKVLVLDAQRDGQGHISWSCNSPDTTISQRYLPLRCRN